jgi:hypothetical protein
MAIKEASVDLKREPEGPVGEGMNEFGNSMFDDGFRNPVRKAIFS